MKSYKLSLILLLFLFSLQSCGGGDGGYITIDLEQQNETNNTETSNNKNQNNEENNNQENGEGSGNDNNNGSNSNAPIPTEANDNINSSKAYLYIDQISSDGMSHQSAACYGDYVFFISNKMIHTLVFNMRTNSRVFYLKQEQLGTGTIYHCNQACFGTQKYSEEDYFPLLYISQFQNKSNRCFIQVFRVLPTSNGINQDFTAFAFELIQTIYFPVFTDENCLYYANAVIDTDNHYIYTYSYDKNSAAETFHQCKISKFNIPDPIGASSVKLSDDDILDSYFIPTEGPYMQGAAYNNGLIYIGKGSPSLGYVYLHVVDLANRRLWFSVELLKNRYFNFEPEGAFFYKDDLYIGASSRIFKFTFKYENTSAKAIAVPFDMPE